MLKTLAGTAILILAATGAYAQCTPSGALGGAAAGAVGGAVIGGPVGAAVGAGIGGAVGAAAMPQTACTYVIQQPVPQATWQGQVVVGQPLPEAVALYPIPQYDTYVFANVNGRRVLVDPRTRVVVQVVGG
ncbi:MAG: DUF1236 domain-containing protein [Bauldia sp.]